MVSRFTPSGRPANGCWIEGAVPRARVYKAIVGDRYRFFVGLAVPMLGTVLSYGRDLALSGACANHHE